MKTNILAIVTCAFLTPTFAQSCPSVQVDLPLQDQLYAALKSAPNEMEGRTIHSEIWETWITAPDEKSQELMDQGRERVRVADYEQAEALFGQLIDYCPDYAEGWNQRAHVRYLRLDYDNALEDITEALEREPRHFGALSGRGLILISIGRHNIGYVALREAIDLNPWMSERYLLPAGEVMLPIGEDI